MQSGITSDARLSPKVFTVTFGFKDDDDDDGEGGVVHVCDKVWGPKVHQK